MPKKKAKNHGGAREGAGRKPSLPDGFTRITFAVTPSLLDAIDLAATDEGKTRSEIIRARLAAAFERE